MTCDVVRERLQEDLDGRLAGREREAIESHLDTCAGCRRYRAGLDDLDALLSAKTEAPAELLRRLPLSPARRRVPRWAYGAAAGVILAVGLGLGTMQGSPEVATVAPEVQADEMLSWFEPDTSTGQEVLPSEAFFSNSEF